MAVGRSVWFHDYDAEGEEIVVHGVVAHEFTEPPEEDPLQRLNFSVVADDGRLFTPYAADCHFTRVAEIRSASIAE